MADTFKPFYLKKDEDEYSLESFIKNSSEKCLIEAYDLFDDFNGYVKFFLLDDLVDIKGNIKFYLPFDNFQSNPEFKNKEDYILYKNKVIDFIKCRNQKIEKWFT